MSLFCFRYDVSDPFRGEYFCPHCWTLQKPVESGATLIVSPRWFIKEHCQLCGLHKDQNSPIDNSFSKKFSLLQHELVKQSLLTTSNMDCQLLHQKLVKKISVMKHKHWCFCCLQDKTWKKNAKTNCFSGNTSFLCFHYWEFLTGFLT